MYIPNKTMEKPSPMAMPNSRSVEKWRSKNDTLAGAATAMRVGAGRGPGEDGAADERAGWAVPTWSSFSRAMPTHIKNDSLDSDKVPLWILPFTIPAPKGSLPKQVPVDITSLH